MGANTPKSKLRLHNRIIHGEMMDELENLDENAVRELAETLASKALETSKNVIISNDDVLEIERLAEEFEKTQERLNVIWLEAEQRSMRVIAAMNVFIKAERDDEAQELFPDDEAAEGETPLPRKGETATPRMWDKP